MSAAKPELFSHRDRVLVAERVVESCRVRVQRRIDAREPSHRIEQAQLVYDQARQHLAEVRSEMAGAVRPVMGGAA